MDGRGRCFDNIFVERLWRTVKQEEVYLKEYANVWEAEESMWSYFQFYNYQRPHQSLKYQTPFEAYQKGQKIEQNKGAKAAILTNKLHLKKVSFLSGQWGSLYWSSINPPRSFFPAAIKFSGHLTVSRDKPLKPKG